MTDIRLTVQGLAVDYPTARVVDNVSFTLGNERLALVGESGSGKTTLARILLGFERADAGQVTIDGIDAGHLSREAQRQLRRKIQFVYQNPFASLDPRQTLFAIIEEPLKNFERLSAATRRQRVESVAARVALAPELLSRTPRELSGGQRQRAWIAMVLAQETAIMLLDEPTNHLDIHHQMQLMQLISELPVTSIVAIHDLNHAAMFCDSLIVMQQGQILASGTPEEILSEALLWDVFRVKTKIEISPYHGKKHIHFIV